MVWVNYFDDTEFGSLPVDPYVLLVGEISYAFDVRRLPKGRSFSKHSTWWTATGSVPRGGDPRIGLTSGPIRGPLVASRSTSRSR